MRDETKCLHSGYTPKNTEPRVVPIVQSTTYVYDSTADVAAVFDEPTKSLIYSRFANPTVMAIENKIAELEGGVGAMCTSSGQAASLMSILNLAQAGDSIVASTKIYGGTVNLFAYTFNMLDRINSRHLLGKSEQRTASDACTAEIFGGRSAVFLFFCVHECGSSAQTDDYSLIKL